ncbi:hypothetical protein [Amycolatopsis sp. NPDC004079]|uniref:hypothetical protein n=1 Tax=Amycolatopsis sp. NPDC004079 TaxID=3154549 RepID=UPI0033B1C7F3
MPRAVDWLRPRRLEVIAAGNSRREVIYVARTDLPARMDRPSWRWLMLVGTVASGHRLGAGTMVAEPLSAKAEAAAG